MTPMDILHQLRKSVLANYADKPEYDAALGSLLTFEFWLARTGGWPMNTFYFPLKCSCGAEATHFVAADQDCGCLDAYKPRCDAHSDGDYSYCLKCLGHLDGHGGDCKVGNCTCASSPPDK